MSVQDRDGAGPVYGVTELREGWRASKSSHLHPAVSVISSSLTMSDTVTTAVLGVPDLVRLHASQYSCSAVELEGIGIYLCCANALVLLWLGDLSMKVRCF